MHLHDDVVRLRIPKALKTRLQWAANRKFMTVSEYLRQSVIKAVDADIQTISALEDLARLTDELLLDDVVPQDNPPVTSQGG